MEEPPFRGRLSSVSGKLGGRPGTRFESPAREEFCGKVGAGGEWNEHSMLTSGKVGPSSNASKAAGP